MSQWLPTAGSGGGTGTGTDASGAQGQQPPPQRRKVADQKDVAHKLTMQLEARMREQEAGDSHFRCPSGHPVIMEMSNAGQQYDSAVKAAGAQHTFGSPHLHAFIAMLDALTKTDTTGKDNEVQMIFKAAIRLKEFVAAGKPDDLEEWVHSCRASEYFKKANQQPLHRIVFNVSGHWPLAKTPEEDLDLQSVKYHPMEIDTATNKVWIQVDRLLTQALRHVGATRLPGKSPVGGLAYQMRRK